MKLYGGGLIVRTLKSYGVKHLFALPGHQILSVFDSCQEEGLDLVSPRHEASAVFMAQALSLAGLEPRVVDPGDLTEEAGLVHSALGHQEM